MRVKLNYGDELEIELPCGNQLAIEAAEEKAHDGQFSLCAWEYDCEVQEITAPLYEVVRDDNARSGE